MSTLVAFLCTLVLIPLRVPIGAAFLFGDILAIALFEGEAALAFVPSQMFTALTSIELLAVPLFILAAELMLRAGIGDAIVDMVLRVTLGRRRLLPVGAVGAAMFFGGMTGSSVAEAAALGQLLYPVMKRRGFNPKHIAGLLASTATLGILIPPSVTLILFGAVTQTSVARLFAAALVPGLISGFVFMLASVFLVKPETEQGTRRPGDWAEASLEPVSSVPAMLFALGAPTIVLGSIYGGFATPTEAAALLIFYALLAVGMFRPGNFWGVIGEVGMSTLRTTSAVFLIIVGSGLFARLATQDQIPHAVADFILSSHLHPVVFLLGLNAVVFVFGCVFEGLSMLLIVAPLVVTTARAMNLSLIYLGVILTVNIELSVITPPLGVNLLTISAVTGMRASEVMESIWRFYVIALGLLLLFIFVPGLVPWAE